MLHFLNIRYALFRYEAARPQKQHRSPLGRVRREILYFTSHNYGVIHLPKDQAKACQTRKANLKLGVF